MTIGVTFPKDDLTVHEVINRLEGDHMNVLEVKQIVEGYQELLTKQRELEAKLDRIGGRNPTLEESYLNKLDEIERQIEIIDRETFESSILTDRESCVLILRTEGYDLARIGEVLGVTREGARIILDKVYKKIAKEAA